MRPRLGSKNAHGGQSAEVLHRVPRAQGHEPASGLHPQWHVALRLHEDGYGDSEAALRDRRREEEFRAGGIAISIMKFLTCRSK